MAQTTDRRAELAAIETEVARLKGTAELETDLVAAGKAYRRARIALEGKRAALYDAMRAARRGGLSIRAVAKAADVPIGTVQQQAGTEDSTDGDTVSVG
jgi:hypothetical protein